MTTTTMPVERTSALAVPLTPRPDQPERWITHSTPVPFDAAAQSILQAHQEDGERDDTAVDRLDTWSFGSSDSESMQLLRVPFAGRLDGELLTLRELAYSQLCAKLGIPAAYIRTLPRKLQEACVNLALVGQNSPALLRIAGDEVRAVVSDRYAAVDDRLLLEVVADTLDRTGFRDDARVRAVAVGPHTLLRITLPNEAIPVRVGDVIEHGIDIGNSELGLRSVQVTPVTHRLVCLNGMRAWKSEASLRMRHIGDPERLRDQLRDAIPVAFAEARGDLDRWKRSVDLLVDSALEEIEALRSHGLSTAEVQSVGKTFAETHVQLPERSSAQSLSDALNTRTSAFEIANAITAAARARDSVPARLALEEVGHRYLTAATS